MRAYDVYWMSNPDWYTIKDGLTIIKEDAPPDAQRSYDRYLEQRGVTREQLFEAIGLRH